MFDQVSWEYIYNQIVFVESIFVSVRYNVHVHKVEDVVSC